MPFLALYVLDKQVHLCCLLKNEMKAKRSNQCKLPSINKNCFLFPLSPFCYSRAVFTRVPIFDRKTKGVKELDRFLPHVAVPQFFGTFDALSVI